MSRVMTILCVIFFVMTTVLASDKAAPDRRLFRSCFGVSCHFAQGMPLSAMDWLTDIGATWMRAEIYWHTVERAPGVYAVPDEAQAWIDEAARRGLNISLHLGYSNEAYDNPWDPDAYARYAAFVAQTLRGKVQVYHCVNEPHNFGFSSYYGGQWNGAGDSPWIGKYAELVRNTAAAVHQVAPEIPIMPDEDVYVNHYRFLDAGLGPYVPALSIHPYTHDSTPPEMTKWAHPTPMDDPYQVADEDGSFVSMLRRLRQHGEDTTGRQFEVWATEWGYLVPDWVDEETAAGYLVRMYIVSFANRVRVVCWHNLQDWGDGAFGLVDNGGNKRLTYFAYKQMAETLGDTYLIRQVRGQHNPTRGIHAYLFGRDEQRILVLWNVDNKPQTVQLRGLRPETQVLDTPGHKRPLHIAAGRAELAIDGQPCYVVGVSQHVSVRPLRAQ